MQPNLDLQIQQKLADYLDRRIALRDFEEWFAPVAWHVDESGNQAAEDLSNEIELRLAEFGRGHWTETELREMLDTMAGTRTKSFTLVSRASSVATSEVSSEVSIEEQSVTLDLVRKG